MSGLAAVGTAGGGGSSDPLPYRQLLQATAFHARLPGVGQDLQIAVAQMRPVDPRHQPESGTQLKFAYHEGAYDRGGPVQAYIPTVILNVHEPLALGTPPSDRWTTFPVRWNFQMNIWTGTGRTTATPIGGTSDRTFFVWSINGFLYPIINAPWWFSTARPQPVYSFPAPEEGMYDRVRGFSREASTAVEVGVRQRLLRLCRHSLLRLAAALPRERGNVEAGRAPR